MDDSQQSTRDPFHLVVAGGGTGGHLFPGVAVVEALQALIPDIKVSFVGASRGIETRVIPELGYDFYPINVHPLKSGGFVGLVKGISHLLSSGHASHKLLKQLKPDFVLAVGGYAAGPFTAVAAKRGYPTAFMEQNANLGLTNKLLSKLVDHAFLSFESTANQLPKKLPFSVVGNPIRRQVIERSQGFTYQPPQPDGPFHLLVLGGSGGARSLNLNLPKLIGALPDNLQRRLIVTHQSGRSRLEEAQEAYKGVGCQYNILPFIDDMASIYSECDLLICRAGMSTIAEVTVLGLPCAFVPFPSADAHQTANANQLVDAKAAALIPDDKLVTDGPATLATLMADPDTLSTFAKNAKLLGRPSAADDVAHFIAERLQASRDQSKAS